VQRGARGAAQWMLCGRARAWCGVGEAAALRWSGACGVRVVRKRSRRGGSHAAQGCSMYGRRRRAATALERMRERSSERRRRKEGALAGARRGLSKRPQAERGSGSRGQQAGRERGAIAPRARGVTPLRSVRQTNSRACAALLLRDAAHGGTASAAAQQATRESSACALRCCCSHPAATSDAAPG
jgi:hypothetical protein